MSLKGDVLDLARLAGSVEPLVSERVDKRLDVGVVVDPRQNDPHDADYRCDRSELVKRRCGSAQNQTQTGHTSCHGFSDPFCDGSGLAACLPSDAEVEHLERGTVDSEGKDLYSKFVRDGPVE